MSKKLPIESLINFTICDDHICTQNDIFYFYRYYPPNISIMTEDEILDEIEQLTRLLNTLNRTFSIFATDKNEDFSEIKKFYESLNPDYDYITTDILEAVENTEVKSTSVQRAFYFVYRTNDAEDDLYNQIIGKGYHIEKADKAELTVLMRNYLTREFIAADIYTIEQEIDTNPKNRKIKEQVRNREILRRLTPHRIDFLPRYAVQGGILRKTLMIKNFPSPIAPTCLFELATLRGTSFHMRLAPMNRAEARQLTDNQLKNRRVQLGSRNMTEKIDAQRESEDIINFYREVAQSKAVVYHINVFIELYGKTEKELLELQDTVSIILAGNAITYEALPYEQREAFLSVYPCGKDWFLADANNMPSTTIAALYPCSYSSRLDQHGMLIGKTVAGGNLFLDMYQYDGNITSSNYAIIGTTGQGKSYLQKKIITQLYIRGNSPYEQLPHKIFVLDPENEYVDLTRKMKGTVINCASGQVKINPLHVRGLRLSGDVDDDDDLNIPIGQEIFYQHLSWLQDFHRVLLPGLSDDCQKALNILIRDTYAKFGITERTDFERLSSKDYPTYSDVYQYILDNQEQYEQINRQMFSQILLYLDDCVKGTLGALFNGYTNIANENFMCFSVAELMQGSRERMQAQLFNITTYVWNEIAKKQGRALLAIDELYMFLDDDNPTMVKYINFFVKRARKYGAQIGIATQQIVDCLKPSIAHYTTALFTNSAFQFLFYPGKIDLSLVEEKLKLTKGELRCISQSNKRHCLLKAGNDKYYIEVGHLPYEDYLFGTAGGR